MPPGRGRVGLFGLTPRLDFRSFGERRAGTDTYCDESGRTGWSDMTQAFDGLEVGHEIGRGGFAVVYRARDLDFQRDVAVKVIQARLDAHGLARFERECAAVGAISHHPHIVAVHRSGVTPDGSAYLVMELLPGGSLAMRVGAAPLSWQAACALGVQLSGALDTAHRAGVLHRDVKPENILFSAFEAPVLVDFGIAAIRGGEPTSSAVITASLSHAAPEILAGGRASAASDVYGLASALHFAMAGRPAFGREGDETLVPLIARIATTPPPDLRAAGVPDAVASAIERGLAKDPADRPESALAFGEALRAAAARLGADLAAPVVPAVPVAHAAEPVREPTSVVGRRREPVAPPTPVEPSGRTRRRGVVVPVAAGVAALLVAGGAWAALSRDGGPSEQVFTNAGTTGSPSPAESRTSTTKPARTSPARPSASPSPAGDVATEPATQPTTTRGPAPATRPGTQPTTQPTRQPTRQPTKAAAVAPSPPRSVTSGGVTIASRNSGGDPTSVTVTVSWAASSGTSPTYCVRRTTMRGTSASGSPVDAGCTSGTSRRVTISAVNAADSWVRWEVRATNTAGTTAWVRAAAKVPYVIGRKVFDATQQLRAAGLRPNYAPRGNPPRPQDNYLVVAQSPRSGTLSGGSRVVVEFYEQS